MTVGEALRAAADALAPRIGRAAAERDARRLMAHATGWSGAGVLARLPEPLEAAPRFAELLEARLAGRSVQHVTGRAEFWGRAFAVGPGDLAPRPDTETLVEAALAVPFARVLDLGTGTGILAVALLAERPGATGVATELREDWLATARANARAHGVDGRLEFRVSDWFASVGGRFDLIVSNPPYLTAAEHAEAPPELAWERPEALSPGGDGLDAYRAIAAGAPGHLAPGGWLMVEIGPAQGAAVAGLFRAAGLDGVTVRPDIVGRDRVVSARRANPPDGP